MEQQNHPQKCIKKTKVIFDADKNKQVIFDPDNMKFLHKVN